MHYLEVMAWGAIVVVVTTALMTAAMQGSRSEIRNSTGAMVGLCFYLFFAVLLYRENYGSFILAEFDEHEVKLSFAGPLYTPAVLLRDQISEVQFDRPGKGTPNACYIRLLTVTGDIYRSAPTAGDVCQQYQVQIQTLMKL